MQNQTSVQHRSNALHQDGMNSASNQARTLSHQPVTGHPYMTQTVPLPPPDVMPPQHPYPVAPEGDTSNPVNSQSSKHIYEKQQEVYNPQSRQHQQLPYAQNQVISNQQLQPSSHFVQNQSE